MRNEQRKNIEDLYNIRIKPSKDTLKNEEDLELLHIIEQMCELEAYVGSIGNLGVVMFDLEEKWVNIITTLLKKTYGEEVTQLINWWVFDSITPEGEVLPIKIIENEVEKEFVVKKPTQLVKLLRKYKILK
jgi:hypothetical protein